MDTRTRGIAYLLISVVLYSSMPLLIRVLGSSHMPPASQVFLRYIVALLASAVYVFKLGTGFRIRSSDLPLLVFTSLFGYALVNYFFTLAALNTQIGTMLFIFNCSTVMGPFLGYVFLREPLTKTKIVAMILGFASLFFLFRPGPMPTWKTGALFALVSAAGSSLYVIGRKMLGSYDSGTILLANTLTGVVTMGIIALTVERNFYFGGGYALITPQVWGITVLFGLLNFSAYLFMTKGYGLVSAGTGSMVMLTENITGILFAFLVFGEIPTVWAVIGGALILAASLTIITGREKIPAPSTGNGIGKKRIG